MQAAVVTTTRTTTTTSTTTTSTKWKQILPTSVVDLLEAENNANSTDDVAKIPKIRGEFNARLRLLASRGATRAGGRKKEGKSAATGGS